MVEERPLKVRALIQQNRLAPVAADLDLAWRHISDADDLTADIANVSRDKTRYDMAYEAAFHAVMALLAGDGLRLTSAVGHHAALAIYAIAVLDTPPDLAEAAQSFDRMRKGRARSWYDAAPVTSQQAMWAAQQAQKLLLNSRTYVGNKSSRG